MNEIYNGGFSPEISLISQWRHRNKHKLMNLTPRKTPNDVI